MHDCWELSYIWRRGSGTSGGENCLRGCSGSRNNWRGERLEYFLEECNVVRVEKKVRDIFDGVKTNLLQRHLVLVHTGDVDIQLANGERKGVEQATERGVCFGRSDDQVGERREVGQQLGYDGPAWN